MGVDSVACHLQKKMHPTSSRPPYPLAPLHPPTFHPPAVMRTATTCPSGATRPPPSKSIASQPSGSWPYRRRRSGMRCSGTPMPIASWQAGMLTLLIHSVTGCSTCRMGRSKFQTVQSLQDEGYRPQGSGQAGQAVGGSSLLQPLCSTPPQPPHLQEVQCCWWLPHLPPTHLPARPPPHWTAPYRTPYLQAWVELQEAVLLRLHDVQELHGGGAHVAHAASQGPRAPLHVGQQLRAAGRRGGMGRVGVGGGGRVGVGGGGHVGVGGGVGGARRSGSGPGCLSGANASN